MTKIYDKDFCKDLVKSVQIRSFFWSVVSRTWPEYGDLLCKSLYSAQVRENTDHKKLRIWTLSRSVMNG